jgi:predicted hydrolase (HD superfamily)
MNLQLNRTTFGNPANTGKLLTKAEAEELFNSWVINPRLQTHMRQVSALMKAWALQQNLTEAEVWAWELAGLLHDADWDQWPDQHCRKIIEELEAKNIDPAVIQAIASHGHLYTYAT